MMSDSCIIIVINKITADDNKMIRSINYDYCYYFCMPQHERNIRLITALQLTHLSLTSYTHTAVTHDARTTTLKNQQHVRAESLHSWRANKKGRQQTILRSSKFAATTQHTSTLNLK